MIDRHARLWFDIDARSGGMGDEDVAISTGYVWGSGVVRKEAGVAFAYPSALGLQIGVALKEVIGEIFAVAILLRGRDESQTMLEDILDQSRCRTGKFGHDLEISFSILPLVSLGMTAKNVRGNKFEYTRFARARRCTGGS